MIGKRFVDPNQQLAARGAHLCFNFAAMSSGVLAITVTGPLIWNCSLLPYEPGKKPGITPALPNAVGAGVAPNGRCPAPRDPPPLYY